MQVNDSDPLVPWFTLQDHIRGRDGRPISVMTLHRWRARNVIEVTTIGGRNYLRLQATLARLEHRAA